MMTLLQKFALHLQAGEIAQAKSICENANRMTLLEHPSDPRDPQFCGTSFLFLALLFKQWEIVAILMRKNAINASIMNTIPSKASEGSVATYLACHQQGLEYLRANNFALTNLISTHSLNSSLPLATSDETLAFTLVSNAAGLDILLHIHNNLGKRITPQTLNRVHTRGRWKGLSLVVILINNYGELGINFFFSLMSAGYTLNSECLNSLHRSTNVEKFSVAAKLSDMREGRLLLIKLMANGVLINQVTLNAIFNIPSLGNISVVRNLLANKRVDDLGFHILQKLHELGVTIDENCLNCADIDGCTPAFYLSSTLKHGPNLLLRLAQAGVHISYETLNKRMKVLAGASVAINLLSFNYAFSAALFKFQDFALARRINVKHLLEILESDANPVALLNMQEFLPRARQRYCLLFTEIFKHDQRKDLTAPNAQETHPVFNARTMLHLKKIHELPVTPDAETSRAECVKAGWQRCVARAL